MNAKAFFACLFCLAGVASLAQAQDEGDDTKELQGYSVGSGNRPSMDMEDMDIEIEKPTFDSGFRLEAPKPSTASIRLERPKLQVMQAPAAPASSGQPAPARDKPAVAERNRSVKPLQMDPPDFPRTALRRGQEGFVVLEFTVSTDGSTRDIAVIESEPRNVFDREAIRAVSGWKFSPAMRDGRPVETRLKHTIDFSLD